MTYYSFGFAANTAQLCMEEIQRRGLQERKIFGKSVPNNGLMIKVFRKKTCSIEDLSCVNIHSVATLMQDALWSTPERIISKSTWRTINYETSTLSELSVVLTKEGEELLISILDFLVDVLRYKHVNLMNVYKLGDALGKVVLGPPDCSPIIEEKAGHFLTRLIIEHAKIHHQQNKTHVKKGIHRIDSGIDYYSYKEYKPLCKADGTQARARYYNRAISKIKSAGEDWCENAIGVQYMLDGEYEADSKPAEDQWVSIFTSTEALLNRENDTSVSPILYRILKEATQTAPVDSTDPFTSSYLFSRSKAYRVEHQLQEAFNEFDPKKFDMHDFDLQRKRNVSAPLKKLNHSLSHIKLNIKKYRSRHDLLEESMISEDTEATFVDDLQNPKKSNDDKHNAMKHMMKKMMKIGADKEPKKSSSVPK